MLLLRGRPGTFVGEALFFLLEGVAVLVKLVELLVKLGDAFFELPPTFFGVGRKLRRHRGGHDANAHLHEPDLHPVFMLELELAGPFAVDQNRLGGGQLAQPYAYACNKAKGTISI